MIEIKIDFDKSLAMRGFNETLKREIPKHIREELRSVLTDAELNKTTIKFVSSSDGKINLGFDTSEEIFEKIKTFFNQ